MCIEVEDDMSGLGRRLLGCFSTTGVMVGLTGTYEPS